MKIIMIRHGATKGNKEGRYVGWTDEGITHDSKRLLEEWHEKDRIFFKVTDVVISPLLRCRQTADILFPGRAAIEVPELRECNFGDFEYKNYKELNGNPVYQRYIDSNGETGFPNGETKAQFQNRCIKGFCNVMKRYEESAPDMVAFVVHGGTVMALLDAYSSPHKDYYEWHIHNGEGLIMDLFRREDGFIMEHIEKIGNI